MKTATVCPGTLVILSGAPASGKSTLATKYPNYAISTDAFRSFFFGYVNEVYDEQITHRPSNVNDGLIFETIKKVTEERMKNGLTTILDGTFPTDSDRREYVKLAEKYNRPVLVVILDVPEERLQKQNRLRRNKVSNAVISKFVQKLETTSQWNHVINPDEINVEPWQIDKNQPLDIIGDVHGCIEIIRLIKSLGYVDGVHPDGRKLLFLGDLVDRGPHSLEVLEFVMYLVSKEAYCILGNHEANLLKGLQGQEVRSHSTRKTLHQVLVNQKEKEIAEFIKSLPSFYLYGDSFICHADITTIDNYALKHFVYGHSTLSRPADSDAIFAAHHPQVRLIRGHIRPTSDQHNVVSLEKGAGYDEGPIVAMRLDKASDKGVFTMQPTCFKYKDQPKTFEQRMEPLVQAKLVNVDKDGPLSLFKYSSKAFYDKQSFIDNADLKLARTAITGMHGELINYAFPQTFNYGESGAPTINSDKQVIWVEKLNGFFAQVLLDPYSKKHRLIYTSSGKFTGPFVEMARKHLQKHTKEMLEVFKTCSISNLMFEIIDLDDPHIVEYNDNTQGAYLIGAGWANESLADEHYLDYLSISLLLFPRPSWGQDIYANVLEKVKTCHHEGYMVRDLTGQYLVKLKSPMYLTIKFISRMSSESEALLFLKPEVMKQKLRSRGLEELQFVVDIVTSEFQESDWKTMNSIEKRDMLIPIVKAHYA